MAEQVYWNDVKEGDPIRELVTNCSAQNLVMWAAASGDFNPIHYDERAAKSQRLEDIIVHGALKAGFLARMLHEWAGEQGKVKMYGCQYRGMDYRYQDIVCKGTITRKYEENGEHLVDLDIWTETGAAQEDDGRPKNPPGQKTTLGNATVALPAR
jgi:hydroxyacyl-ACP dehydratase HTD2-like protein with hotdog domain